MLKITRNLRESIIIGDDVEVHNLGVTKNGVKIGISAPKHISVDRMEVREEKDRERASQEES